MTENQYTKEFSESLLFIARTDAKGLGVDIPKSLTTMYQPAADGSKYYYVYAKKHGLVWEGYALNAAYAKAKYINALIDDYLEQE